MYHFRTFSRTTDHPGYWTRYVSYVVTVRDQSQGKTRNAKALFLLGRDEKGKEEVLPIDLLTGNSILHYMFQKLDAPIRPAAAPGAAPGKVKPDGGGSACDLCFRSSGGGGGGGGGSCRSPIIIDTTGGGNYALTSIQDGVVYDALGNGKPTQMAWTQGNSPVGFLVLDLNGNGKIDSFKEMFGNVTAPMFDNGFHNLQVSGDYLANGGTNDGQITIADSIFARLKIWIDANHDGITQTPELFTLPHFGITAIHLIYTQSATRDQYGNHFAFAGTADGPNGPFLIYDVFFAYYDSTTGQYVTSC